MCEHLTNISVYETAQKAYIVGEDTEQDDCWHLLKIDRTNSPAAEDLTVVEDPTHYSWRKLQSALRCLHDGNLSSGGLRKIIGPCPALVGACFAWTACPYLLLVTKTRTLGHIGGDNPIYGIEATTLIPLGQSGELLPQAIAEQEARARRLLSLVALTKDFFFSFSWPIWNTVQRTFAKSATSTEDHLDGAFFSDRVWNEHLTSRLRTSLGDNHSRWVIPLVHGFFEQKHLSLLGRPLLLTLVARRSSRFAGTRYRKRGVTDDGKVANDVEIEQILELIDSSTTNSERIPQISSALQVRGSVPLYWSQTWDPSTAAATAALRPSIRMLHYLDPLYSATGNHFDDLRKRYGNGTIHCLDLLRHGDSKQQESVLSTEYKNAIMSLNRRARSVSQRVGYVHWDLRRHARKLSSSLLADLQKVQAPLLASTGIFSSSPPPPSSFSSSSSQRYRHNEQGQLQRGIVRTNCVDCLDRTNVAQFTFGLLAIGQQLHALGLAPSATVPIDPGSSLASELMNVYESMGHALAQQYGGSEAHTGFFKQQITRLTGGSSGDWQASLHMQGKDLLTSIKRFYSNAVTDEDKQAAINLFLGTFSPAMAAAETAKWGGWFKGRAASAAELSNSGGSGGYIADNTLLLAREPPVTNTATSTDTNNKATTTTELSPRSSSLFVNNPSPPESPLLPSLSTASVASDLEGINDLSLPEILSSAVVPASGTRAASGDGDCEGAGEVDTQKADARQQQQQKKPWPPHSSPRANSRPLTSDFTGNTSRGIKDGGGGLQSFDTMLPRDVRHVRLYSQHPPVTSKARSAGGTPVQPAFARGPPIRNTPLLRSNSAGNAEKLALEAARGNTVPQQQQQQQLAATGNNVRNARDLRGSLVILGPGESSHYNSNISRNGSHVVDIPVLPLGNSEYHTLAGLNLEGAPEVTSSLSTSCPTDFTRPSTAGNNPMTRDKRVSFASVPALRRFVPGDVQIKSEGVSKGSSKVENRAASGYIPGTRSQSVIDSNSRALHGTYDSNMNTTMAPGPAIAVSDLSWMFTQHQAVAHGLDDLGLPAHVAPFYRPGSNVVNCFFEMGRQVADQQAAAMAKLVVIDAAEHRAAEREVAALLRPEVMVTLPEKAFYKF